MAIIFDNLDTSCAYVGGCAQAEDIKIKIRAKKARLEEFFTDVGIAMVPLREYIDLLDVPSSSGTGPSWNKDPISPDKAVSNSDSSGSEQNLRYLHDALIELDAETPFIVRNSTNNALLEPNLSPAPGNSKGQRTLKRIAKIASDIVNCEKELIDIYSFLRIIYLRSNSPLIPKDEIPKPKELPRDIPQSLRIGQHLIDQPFAKMYKRVPWPASMNMYRTVTDDISNGSLEYASQNSLRTSHWKGKWGFYEFEVTKSDPPLEGDFEGMEVIYDPSGLIGVEDILVNGKPADGWDAYISESGLIVIDPGSVAADTFTVLLRRPTYIQLTVGEVEGDFFLDEDAEDKKIYVDVRRDLIFDKEVYEIHDLFIDGNLQIRGPLAGDLKDYEFETGAGSPIVWHNGASAGTGFSAKVEVWASTDDIEHITSNSFVPPGLITNGLLAKQEE